MEFLSSKSSSRKRRGLATHQCVCARMGRPPVSGERCHIEHHFRRRQSSDWHLCQKVGKRALCFRCQPPWRQGSAFRTLGRAIAQTLYELRILLLYPTYSRQWGTHSRTKSQEEYRTKQVPERESMAVCGESRVNERRGELHIR